MVLSCIVPSQCLVIVTSIVVEVVVLMGGDVILCGVVE